MSAFRWALQLQPNSTAESSQLTCTVYRAPHERQTTRTGSVSLVMKPSMGSDAQAAMRPLRLCSLPKQPYPYGDSRACQRQENGPYRFLPNREIKSARTEQQSCYCGEMISAHWTPPKLSDSAAFTVLRDCGSHLH